MGAAVSVTGYRVAMLVSGALALILSEYIGGELPTFDGTYHVPWCYRRMVWPEPTNPGIPPQK
ncbi:MAG: hypothetical protein CM1200mP16_03130 [Nitrospina sp.]|nr:MAG: hypothetical protein CM1200mP16_03130 [Nitrospina sp.]